MSSPPQHPKIYHITHVDNLPAIIAAGELISDAAVIAQGGPQVTIGMGKLKKRRLELPVTCHSGDHVADYVPFYFCPRSVMLYLLHQANHSELAYRGGQGPIVHLEADMQEVVGWADGEGRRWAFSLSNAAAYYCQFRASLADLGDVNWQAVDARNWVSCREEKQAEFLLHGTFPWTLVRRIGVVSDEIAARAAAALHGAPHRPSVEIRRDWYY
ncbi:type II toxin-antitoxin system toxin DNA ADP-ribosyl transferase DarT [Arenibaculum sp.]|jgi:hypothetical protein|uniref:type II toxin-antitoxin system toxin DNA ADP-ribosyl transferase DarT n=1 Tax=Arenibaculum sp. TaxID=2865862 RepID=UPI002E0FC3EE|nr:DUF4433 domain-containing protein [Arenibaculum sp.]